MAFKFVSFCAILACANAGLIGAPAAVAYSDASAVSSAYFHQATAPVVAKVATPIAAYAAPAVHATYAAPAIAKVATPVAYHAPAAYAAPAIHTTYAAPAIAKVATTYAAPAIHATYAAPAIAKVSTYAAPALSYAPAAIHDPHYGATHQSVYRSLGGDSAISHYSKAVDSAFSSVRKYDTRITNDARTLVASPVVSSYAHAPVVSTYAAHAPVVAHASPVVAHHAPVAAYSAAPAAVVSHASFSGLGAQYGW